MVLYVVGANVLQPLRVGILLGTLIIIFSVLSDPAVRIFKYI